MKTLENKVPTYEDFYKATVEELKKYEQFENLKSEEFKEFEEDIQYEYRDAVMALEDGDITLELFLSYIPKSAAYGIFMLN
ncbi:MAG: hypothetical protein ACLVK5_00475 [Peptoniphilus senegalensis]